MSLVEIENSLPNGFHDALLESVEIDYSLRRALIKMRLCIGGPGRGEGPTKEGYKRAALELIDLVYLIIEGPDPRSKFSDAEKELWIDGGEATPDSTPPMPVPIDLLPPGAFAYWFFVNNWNSFIQFAAVHAKLHWIAEELELPTVRREKAV